MRSPALILGLAVAAVAFASSAGVSNAAPFYTEYGFHGPSSGDCVLPHHACLGHILELAPAPGLNQIDLTVLPAAGADSVRFGFHASLGVPVADSLFPILGDQTLPERAAYAVGYKSIVLKNGNYKMRTTGLNPQGEVTIPAVLSGPIGAPGLTPIGMLVLASVLGIAGLAFIVRKRNAIA